MPCKSLTNASQDLEIAFIVIFPLNSNFSYLKNFGGMHPFIGPHNHIFVKAKSPKTIFGNDTIDMTS